MTAHRSTDWFEVLLAARRLATQPPNKFTSAELAEAAGITGTRNSSAVHVTSAYCSKFEKWGYFIRVDSVPTTGRAWVVWTVTDQGMTRPKPKRRRKWK